MTAAALPLLLPAAPGAGEQRLVRLEEFAGRRFDAEQEALPGL